MLKQGKSKPGKRVSAVSENKDKDSGKQAWTADIQIRNTRQTFKIDTGADVTVVPEQVYRYAEGP